MCQYMVVINARRDPSLSARLDAAFIIVLILVSTIIFYPNHVEQLMRLLYWSTRERECHLATAKNP